MNREDSLDNSHFHPFFGKAGRLSRREREKAGSGERQIAARHCLSFVPPPSFYPWKWIFLRIREVSAIFVPLKMKVCRALSEMHCPWCSSPEAAWIPNAVATKMQYSFKQESMCWKFYLLVHTAWKPHSLANHSIYIFFIHHKEMALLPRVEDRVPLLHFSHFRYLLCMKLAWNCCHSSYVLFFHRTFWEHES